MKQYYELKLIVKPQEMFANGKYVFITQTTISAVLHQKQVENPRKFDQIKQIMWSNLCKEKNWDAKADMFKTKTNRVFELRTIPWKSQPITYHI